MAAALDSESPALICAVLDFHVCSRSAALGEDWRVTLLKSLREMAWLYCGGATLAEHDRNESPSGNNVRVVAVSEKGNHTTKQCSLRNKKQCFTVHSHPSCSFACGRSGAHVASFRCAKPHVQLLRWRFFLLALFSACLAFIRRSRKLLETRQRHRKCG